VDQLLDRYLHQFDGAPVDREDGMACERAAMVYRRSGPVGFGCRACQRLGVWMSRLLVGRARELSLLSRSGHAAAVGEGSVVLVAGEAGIGKTRLLSAAYAEFTTFTRVVWGRCDEGGVLLRSGRGCKCCGHWVGRTSRCSHPKHRCRPRLSGHYPRLEVAER
jgi:hypothetical protein